MFTTKAGAAAGALLLLLGGGGRVGPALACLGLVAGMAVVLLKGAVRLGEVGAVGAPRPWAADAVAAWLAYGLAAVLAGLAGGAAVVAGTAMASLVWLALGAWRRAARRSGAGPSVNVACSVSPGPPKRRVGAAGVLTARTAAAGVLEGLAWLCYAQALSLAPLVAGSINAFQGLAVVAGGRAALGERVTLRLAVACALGVGAVFMAMRAG